MLRLKEIREFKNISQTEMANDLGISRQSYNHYELGRREPDLQLLKQMASYLDVKVDDLIAEDSQPLELTPKLPKDLKRILKDEEITLNGRIMSEEDKEKLYQVFKIMYGKAKEYNEKD